MHFHHDIISIMTVLMPVDRAVESCEELMCENAASAMERC